MLVMFPLLFMSGVGNILLGTLQVVMNTWNVESKPSPRNCKLIPHISVVSESPSPGTYLPREAFPIM